MDQKRVVAEIGDSRHRDGIGINQVTVAEMGEKVTKFEGLPMVSLVGETICTEG